MRSYSRRELYALGETLGDSVTQRKLGGSYICGSGGGGSSGPTQTNVQNTNIPEYARPFVETMLGTAQQQIYNYGPGTAATPDTQRQTGTDENGQPVYETVPGTPATPGSVTGFKPYVPYGATVDAQGRVTNTAQEQANAAVAGFSPLQQMSFQNASNLGLPGQYNTGTGYAALGGMGAANIADRASRVGQEYAQMATDPRSQQAYMSPYIQNALNPQLQEMNRQYGITANQMRGQAAGAGAFGGSRAALQLAENQRNKNAGMNQAIGQGYQNAFQAAQQAQQFGSNLGLQGYNTALQGANQVTQAGATLADIGGKQLQGQQSIIGLQNQMGSQQQTQEQNKINQAIQNYAMQQQYPMQQLSNMSNLLRGLPMQSATTQSYQAAPSAISQLSGLGLTGAAAYGLMKKEGGIIKGYAEGGTIEDDTENFVSGGIAQAITNKVRMNPDGYSKDTINRGTKNALVDDIVGLAAIQEKNKAEKERQAAAAMAQGTPPTVKDQILAERAALEQQRQQGIEMAQSNLPTEYAGGGIVAFDNGGEVEHFEEGGSAFSEDLGKAKDWYKQRVLSGVRSMIEPVIDLKNYFTVPRQSPRDADAQPGGLYSTGTNVPPSESTAAPTRPDTGIRILDNAPSAKPVSGSEKPTGAPEMQTNMSDAGGIDALIKQLTGDLKESSKANADARKEAKLMGMLQAGLGILGGTSQFAAANFKNAIPALQNYQEEMRGIRGEESKQLAQVAALNLKGVELKNELKKLGISEQHYKDWRDVYMAKANKPSGSAGLGSVSSSVVQAELNNLEGFKANPATAPFFKQLPQDAQIALTKTKPGSASYNKSMELFNQFGNQYVQGRLNTMRAYSAKQQPIMSSSTMLEP
jgi:hypothetical protein